MEEWTSEGEHGVIPAEAYSRMETAWELVTRTEEKAKDTTQHH